MRVLLVYPDARRELIGWGDLGAIAEPLALEYIGAATQQAGHEARILDLRLHPDDLEPLVRGWQPDVVGVTGYSMHVLRNLEVCATVKSIAPRCRTVVGGHHATLLPEDFFEPAIDHVVVGEGTSPFRSLLGTIAADAPATAIPAVWTRGPDGTFRSGGLPGEVNLDRIPCPTAR